MLVDAHKHQDLFIYKDLSKHQDLPLVFPLEEARQPAGGPCIVSKKEFERNLDIFTEFQLRYLNWDNVFLAGGTALACLKPLPGEHSNNNVSRRHYYHMLAYKSSDVDLFIYGLNQEQANKKLSEIFTAVQESIPHTAIAFRSTHAVTIVSQFPYRHIQIVLRLYKSPAEILMGFDVDACSVGYDGKSVWMTPRCHRAITCQYNVIDMSRRSPSYEMRLAKYSERGFSVLVPTLDRDRVDPQLFEHRFDQLQGLAKLLLLESLQTAQARTTYKEQQRLRKLRPAGNPRASFWTALAPRFNDDFSRERLEAEGGADASDYSTVFLPWGPTWTAEKCRKMMYTKDMILNSKWYDPKKKHHTHPCFFGTIDEIVKDCCGHCPPVASKEDQEMIETMFVSGPMTWVTVNPGSQTARIGSFHPITEGDWTEGAYVPINTEKMCAAIARNDVATVRECLDAGALLDGADPVGRTPLHIAAFVGAVDVAKELISRGARISKRTSEGRTAVMIAAQYGHAEIIKLLIQRGKELEVSNELLQKESGKKQKAKKKKRNDDDMDEEDEDEEEEEEDMDEDGDGDGDGDEDDDGDGFEGIASLIAKKKQAQLDAEAAADPSTKGDDGLDVLDLDESDWDFKMTALHFAAFFGNSECVSLLVESGAKTDRQLYYAGPNGNKIKTYTLMHLALLNNHVKVIELLLKLGAPIEQMDLSSQTLLHKAASYLNLDALVLLLEHKTKPDINAFDAKAQTPLILAIMSTAHSEAQQGEPEAQDPCSDLKYEVVEYLISEGAIISFTEALLPANYSSSQHTAPSSGFGGFGTFGFPKANSTAALSKRGLFRQFISHKTPLTHVVRLGSLRLLKLFMENNVDVTFPLREMPLDYVDRLVESLESNPHYEQIKKTLSFLRGCRPKDKNSYQYFEFRKLWKKMTTNKPQDSTKDEHSVKQLKRFKEIRDTLKSAGARNLKDIRLSPQDSDLASQQQQHQPSSFGKAKTPKQERPTFSYLAVQEPIPGLYYRSAHVFEASEQSRYSDLFEAIWEGQEEKIKKLCAVPPIGQQAHVCSSSQNSDLSSIMLAYRKNNPAILKLLLEICLKQYTPLAPPVPLEAEKTRALNNYEMMALMDHIRPGNYLTPSGTSVYQPHETIDPNAPKVQLNCTTSPAGLLLWGNGSSTNIIHLAATTEGSEKCLTVIFDYIVANDVKPPKLNLADQKMTKPTSFLQDLLATKNSFGLTPFELAIASGNIPAAKILLSHGGVTPNRPDSEQEDDYQGLDVGGKKMDWALEHKAPMEKAATHATIHIAGKYNQMKSISFLLTEAQDLYQKHYPKATTLPHFRIDTADPDGNTVYHWLIGSNQNKGKAALQALIALDAQKIFNKPNLAGITPLHLAASLGSDAIVKVLLDSGADFTAVDGSRGWTALHFAACVSCEPEPKKPATEAKGKSKKSAKVAPPPTGSSTETLKHLLAVSDHKTANIKSLIFEQTPLIVAVHYGVYAQISDTTRLRDRKPNVELMLASKKCDTSVSDACGEQAIQHAVKHECYPIIDLLSGHSTNLEQESGLGLNIVDTSMMMLLAPLAKHRAGNHPNTDDAQQDSRQLATYHMMQKKTGMKRKTCQLSDVNRFSRIMIERANALTQTETNKLSRWHRKAADAESIDCHTLVGAYNGGWTRFLQNLPVSEESSESEEDSEEEAPTTLKGLTIALSGTLTRSRADVIALIKKNGGTYATSVTKAVTHVICQDPTEDSAKLVAARNNGKKIVGEGFLSKL